MFKKLLIGLLAAIFMGGGITTPLLATAGPLESGGIEESLASGDGGRWLPYTIDFVETADGFEVNNKDFSYFIPKDIKSGMGTIFRVGEYWFTYRLSGSKMQWTDAEGSKTKAISAIQPSVGVTQGNEVTYTSAFQNTDIYYLATSYGIKEYFVLDSLPYNDGKIIDSYIEYTGELDWSDDLSVWVDGVEYSNKTFSTSSEVIFKDKNTGKEVFYLHAPTAWDSSEEPSYSGVIYDFKVSAGKIQYGLRVPYSWLQAATFPVYIDPWVSPTGANAPAGGWGSIGYAYDDDTGTRAATSGTIDAGTWSEFLEFSIAEIFSDKIRVWADCRPLSSLDKIDIDIYYNSSWYNVFEGVFDQDEWYEKSLGGSYFVTKVRFRLYNSYSSGYPGYINEVDFWQIPVVVPTVTTQAVTAITLNTATGNGNITDIGNESNDKRGIVYGTTSQGAPGNVSPPATYDSYEEETGSFGTGSFARSLTGLTPGQIYYVRAYAHNSAGYGYGGEVSFYTPPGDPSNLVATTISSTQIDLAWTRGTGGDKTMIRRKEGSYPTSESDGSQAYFDTDVSYSDTGRSPGTLYYYRAWAYDTNSTDYSSGYTSDTATTLGPPSMTTNAATNVEETTATLNGEITSLNDGNATTRGFEWDIDTGSPYANDWYGEGSFGIGTFDHGITGLTKGELYYYRVYAINTYGTGYGSEVIFLTKPDEPNTFAAVVVADDDIDLTWIKPASADTTYIVRKDGSYPANRADGTNVYNGALELYHDDDAGLVAGHTYYYRAWSYATEGGEEQYSDLYVQVSIILTLGLELWYQPETIISGTTLIDRQGSYDGVITWGGRLTDSGSIVTLTDSQLTQADDFWNGYTLKVKETTDGNAPEGEEAAISDFTDSTLGGTADSGSTTTLVDAELVQPEDYWNGATVVIVTTTDGGAPQGESKTVSNWELGINTLTFPAMTAVVDAGDTYTLTAADTLFFEALTAGVEAGDRYEIWDGQTILWGGFPEGIKVAIGPLTAYTDPVSSAVGLEAPEVAGLPSEPSGMFGGAATSDLPMYELFDPVAAQLGWTTDVLYVVAWMILSIGMGLALLLVTGSTLGAVAGVSVGMVGGMATGMLPVWVLLVYMVFALTWLYVSRSM